MHLDVFRSSFIPIPPELGIPTGLTGFRTATIDLLQTQPLLDHQPILARCATEALSLKMQNNLRIEEVGPPALETDKVSLYDLKHFSPTALIAFAYIMYLGLNKLNVSQFLMERCRMPFPERLNLLQQYQSDPSNHFWVMTKTTHQPINFFGHTSIQVDPDDGYGTLGQAIYYRRNRGQGIGSLCTSYRIDYARNKGLAGLKAWVAEENIPSSSVLEGNGFYKTGRFIDKISAHLESQRNYEYILNLIE